MCVIELATNTITAESKIGSHRAVMETIRFSHEAEWAQEVPILELARAYAHPADRVNHYCLCGEGRRGLSADRSTLLGDS